MFFKELTVFAYNRIQISSSTLETQEIQTNDIETPLCQLLGIKHLRKRDKHEMLKELRHGLCILKNLA